MLLVIPSPARLKSEPVGSMLGVVPCCVSLRSEYRVYCRLPSPQCGGKTPCDFHFGSASCLYPVARIYRTAWEFDLEIQDPHLNRCYPTRYPSYCSIFIHPRVGSRSWCPSLVLFCLNPFPRRIYKTPRGRRFPSLCMVVLLANVRMGHRRAPFSLWV